jgi:integrase
LRTDWVCHDTFALILALLTPENRLAVEMSARYGMRIGDVLKTKTSEVLKGDWTYTEEKTGKHRRIRCSGKFRRQLLDNAGDFYVFEHRYCSTKHRTRQAVYKDIKRASKALRLDENIGTHTARKIYAVDRYRVSADLSAVQRLLNHASEAVTMIYALADTFTQNKKK